MTFSERGVNSAAILNDSTKFEAGPGCSLEAVLTEAHWHLCSTWIRYYATCLRYLTSIVNASLISLRLTIVTSPQCGEGSQPTTSLCGVFSVLVICNFCHPGVKGFVYGLQSKQLCV